MTRRRQSRRNGPDLALGRGEPVPAEVRAMGVPASEAWRQYLRLRLQLGYPREDAEASATRHAIRCYGPLPVHQTGE